MLDEVEYGNDDIETTEELGYWPGLGAESFISNLEFYG